LYCVALRGSLRSKKGRGQPLQYRIIIIILIYTTSDHLRKRTRTAREFGEPKNTDNQNLNRTDYNMDTN